jgi:SAM-dependent methyltransferase
MSDARGAGVIGWLHGRHVAGNRVQRLADRLAPLIPDNAQVLDVGCGDGSVAQRIMHLRPDVVVRGLDVLIRPAPAIPVEPFDGQHLPCGDASVDTVMFVDVLHHTTDPHVLLAEAARVARRRVILKDHTRDGWLAQATLRFMDWVGNAHHGVALPYNYWSRREWDRAFEAVGLRVREWIPGLALYPMPASLVFDRSLHFIAVLETTK